LERVESNKGKAHRIALFKVYLYMSEGFRDEQIKRVLTTVTYILKIAGECTNFLRLAIMTERNQRVATQRKNADQQRI
jgi:hypothetical protein